MRAVPGEIDTIWIMGATIWASLRKGRGIGVDGENFYRISRVQFDLSI